MKTERKKWENKLMKVVLNKWFWIAIISFNFVYPIHRSMNRKIEKLPVFSKLPSYSLTDERSKSFGTNELKDKVYVANFIFTRCASTCTKILKKTQKLQKRLRGVGDKAKLVTFTVDPEFDTPKVLKSKADSLKANPRLWKFVTGSRKDLTTLFLDGFKIFMPEQSDASVSVVDNNSNEEVDLFDLAHSEKFILVDQNGTIRGYYSADKKSLDKLMIDVGLLVNGFI